MTANNLNLLLTVANALTSAQTFEQQAAALVATGMAQGEAEHWVDVTPLAFARAAYRFHYQGPYPVDKQRDIQGLPPLDDDTVYQQAMRWACDCGAMDSINADVFNCIVRLSPELEVIRGGYQL
jgi:hypothetical protein